MVLVVNVLRIKVLRIIVLEIMVPMVMVLVIMVPGVMVRHTINFVSECGGLVRLKVSGNIHHMLGCNGLWYHPSHAWL